MTSQAAELAASVDVDLWTRLREGMQFGAVDHPAIEREIERFQRYPATLTRWIENALPFLHYIADEVERRDLPMEFALLPIVESGFEPSARSPLGAAGIWQFMPATGRHLGLKQDASYDGRLDLIASTEAALTYLQQLSEQVDGDWGLALAAYNAGVGRVQKAIASNRRAGEATDYWSLDLPRETEKYLPRLLAVSRIISDPNAFGFELESVPDEPYFSRVQLHLHLDERKAAELAGVSARELRRLNPAYKGRILDPADNDQLLVPVAKAEEFAEVISSLAPDELLDVGRYVVEEGDNLGYIAQRFGTTVKEIQRSNGLTGTFLRVGQELVVPSGATRADATLTRKDDAQPIQGDPPKRVHVVQQGDSLWTVARKYNVEYRQLATWNGISTRATLQPGQVLELRKGV